MTNASQLPGHCEKILSIGVKAIIIAVMRAINLVGIDFGIFL